MSTALTLVNLAVVGLVLMRDFGHRRVPKIVTLLRPLVLFVLIVPFVMPGWDFTGNGLLLQLAAIVAGAGIGVLTCAFMKISRDDKGQEWSDAGVAYAVVWAVVVLLRQGLIYGSQHWFTHDLGVFLVDNRISVHAYAGTIMFLSVTTVFGNRLALLLRSRRLATTPTPSIAT
ncbi:hypothetical protein AB0L06_40985 [Spirillospora sp. NPDC052269]